RTIGSNLRRIGTAALACIAVACSDASKPGAPVSVMPGAPSRLIPINLPVSAEVATEQKILARVTDASANPVPGVTVTWTVVNGGGAVTPSSTTSDANGLVTTTYTLGEAAGSDRLRALVGASTLQDFDIKAVPGPLAALTPLYTDLSLRVGASFSGTVRAVDV